MRDGGENCNSHAPATAISVTVRHVVELSPETLAALDKLSRLLIGRLPAVQKVFEKVVAEGFAPGPDIAAAQTAPPATPQRSDLTVPLDPAFVETRLYTPPREAIIRFRYPSGMNNEEIRRLLNELPGRKFDTSQQVSSYAMSLGLKRGAVEKPAAVAEPEARAGVQRSTAKPAPLPPRSGRVTPERYAILERDYPAGVSDSDIAARLNALPGPKIPLESIKLLAQSLGLRRPSVGKLRTDHAEPSPAVRPPGGADVIDYASALRWATENRVRIMEGTNKRAALIIINDARRERGLPQWDIVEKMPAAGAMAP